MDLIVGLPKIDTTEGGYSKILVAIDKFLTRTLVDVRGGTPTVTLPLWDTRKTAARRTYKMLSNSAVNASLAITKQLLTT